MPNLKIITAIILLLAASATQAQTLKGTVTNADTKQPIQYVNIGVPGGNTGTVSDENGQYELQIPDSLNQKTIRFSCIGYEPYIQTVSEFKSLASQNISLNEKVTQLSEVLVLPKKIVEKTLGIKTSLRNIAAGFKENKLGYELGIMMKTNKTMTLKTIHINFSHTTYDSIFYRLNVYEEIGKMQFENILTKPYYISIALADIKETIAIDISHLRITSNKNLLVTLEHVRNLGEKGYLYFCAAPGKKTYYRKTSQGDWESARVGISISADVLMEK